jgi:hypothetical protein
MELTEMIEKCRKSYTDLQYVQVIPLAENLGHLTGLTGEQVKAIERVVKKFEDVSKKMAESEAKLKTLSEVVDKLVVNNPPQVKALADYIKAELSKIETRQEHRKIVQIFLQTVHSKRLEENGKDLMLQVNKLKSDIDGYGKQIESWSKNALETTVKEKTAVAKENFDTSKKSIPISVATEPNDLDYDKQIAEIVKKIIP